MAPFTAVCEGFSHNNYLQKKLENNSILKLKNFQLEGGP